VSPSKPAILTRIYYRVKPFVPGRVRWKLRRLRARWILNRGVGETWPINEAAATPPDGWTGWPEGKQFAVVLTHDVESRVGLDKVRQLAELEMELGFRSSFNFIPEGPYRVPDELRSWLNENGFEVGVHDLNHDGRLYASRESFRRKAERINHYLKEWGAVGFRSGFMLRQLDWLHDLELAYDASTFDTDPFEPQPDGAGNIFPFLVAKESGSYVEMPYTLPQDSTLFLLLRERMPDIWLRKLDWLAGKGGMALLNLHPDYIDFDGDEAVTFPAAHYRTLLETIRDRHAGPYWHALPREVAAFARSVLPDPPARPARRVCMVTHSFYESDNRVMRYAETLAARGDTVDVLALRQSADLPAEETLCGVRVVRVRDRFDKSTKGALGHLFPVLCFMRSADRWMKASHRQAPYDLLHIHNMPDFVVFAGHYAKRHGAKVILDIHDIVPEFYASKFGKKDGSPSVLLLKWLERASARFADHMIIANHLWRDRYAERTDTEGRCSAFINHVDSSVFVPVPSTRDDGKQIVLFPGSLSWHQGVDIAIEAFRKVRAEIPNAEFHIYGDGISRPALRAQAKEAGLNGSIRFFDARSLREIARIMADADLGVVPKRAESFGDEAYSTKIMEFMAVGVPVVISSTTVDRFYFDDSVVRFFESGNVDALAEAMIDLLRHPEKRRAMVRRAAAYAKEHCWNRRKDDYLEIVDSLCSR
jgi:glycosyltransferase involved in cell wall biosynthesis